MAKGKHAAALFEVIHSGKDTSGLLRTPKWWFKGRKQEEPASQVEQASVGPAVGAAPIVDPTDPVAPESSVPAPHVPGIDLKLDPDHHQITFRVSYASAIVSGFAVIVVVVLAFVIGRHMSRGPASALAGPSTEQIRQGPVRADVLSVSPANPNAAPAPGRRTETREPDDAASSGAAGPQNSKSITPDSAVAVPTPAIFSGKRTINLNYVIIQSYPDESSANDAIKALAENGVSATIEKGLRGYSSSWFTVVGTEGFTKDQTKTATYTDYFNKIQQISDKFAKNKRSFKAFQPMGYKWDRP